MIFKSILNPELFTSMFTSVQSSSSPPAATCRSVNHVKPLCPSQASVVLRHTLKQCCELTVGELQHLVDDSGLVLGDPHVLQDLDHHLQR